MNEAGVLGAFVHSFGRIVAMMQFNMYHHYTVDEHLIRCIGALNEIARGTNPEFGLANELIKTIQPQHRAVLCVALFLHDIAKGRIEDHSLAGTRIARRLCPRLGLNAAETELVAWLVEVHLVMSTVAQSRDLSDRKTIENFAAVAQSLERLKLLTILTTADIRAVGPGVWNGWKAQLLRTLYYETEPVLTGGFSEVNRAQRVAIAQARIPRRTQGLAGADQLNAYVERLYPAYWLKVDLPHKIAHAQFVRASEEAGKKLATSVGFDAARGVTELTVFAPDHPWLLSIIAGACALAGANIVDAQIYTTTDGLALDTIAVSREFERDEDEARRAARIGDAIEKAVRGQLKLPDVVAKRAAAQGPAQGFRHRAGSLDQQPMVGPLHRGRSHRPRPARPALRADHDALQAQPEHCLGPCRDLRRARRRRVLRDRSPRRPDHGADPPGRDQAAAAWRCLRRRPRARRRSEAAGQAGLLSPPSTRRRAGQPQ